MAITIYHNPNCGTSRNALAIIRKSGEEPEIIEYLKTPPTREKLIHLLPNMAILPRDLLRLMPNSALATPNGALTS